MLRQGISVAFAVAVLASSVSAADSPQVAAMKEQVKTLKAQKVAAAKSIQAQYDAVINQKKMNEAQLAAARKELAAREAEIKALGDTSPEAKTAKSNLDSLRHAMFDGGVLDAKQIAALRTQRNTHVSASNAAYEAKIKELEANIKSASAAKTKK